MIFERVIACLTLAFAVGCSDRGTVSPVAPGHVRLSVAPRLVAATAGAAIPIVPVTKVKAVLKDATGKVIAEKEVAFVNDTAKVDFDVTLTGPGPNDFTVEFTEFDKDNNAVYSGSKKITLSPGDNPAVVPTSVDIAYVAPDANLKTIKISPSSLALNAGATATLSVTGADDKGQAVSPIKIGNWATGDATIATVDANGVVTAGKFQGATTITVTSVTGVKDAITVSVKAPVSRVTITPASASLVRGQSTSFTAALFDEGGHVIADGRAAAFSSSDPSKVTVSGTGQATAVAVGTATISASAEGKTATAAVTVGSPIDHVEITPTSLSFNAFGQTGAVSATVVAKPGGNVTGIVPTLSIDNAAVATLAGGVVTAKGNGSATITASAEGFTATATVTVQQTVAQVTVSPKSASATALGQTATFTATASDANGNPMTATFTWSSSNSSIATVSGNGVATAKSQGSVAITATAGGKSDAATFVVQQLPRSIQLRQDSTTIHVNSQVQLTATLVDAAGNPVQTNLTITWSSSNSGIASVNSNGLVSGVSPGTARITVSAGAFTTFIDITVVANPSAMAISPSSAEKIPNGTQQFSVTGGGGGPFIWSVNGVDAGNATFGTIDASGFYTAPSSQPNPSSFQVCARRQAAPSDRACATMTINPIPSSGGEVIVFNDINMFDNSYGSPYANNVQLFKNLVNYTASGARASQHTVLFHRGHLSRCGGGSDRECMESDFSGMYTTIRGEGFTITDVDDVNATITSIASNVKVIFLLMPITTYSNAEINVLKSFAADGGRIVFVGERQPYYGPSFYSGDGIATENDFFQKMGAVMRNVGGDYACIYQMDASHIRPHQVTTGLTGISMACASAVQLGPNDYALVTDQFTSNVILAAVAKVDLTPLTTNQIGLDGLFNAQAPAPLAPQRTSLPASEVPHSWGNGPRPQGPPKR